MRACVLLAPSKCWRERHNLEKRGFIHNTCMCTHRDNNSDIAIEQQERKKKNKPLKQEQTCLKLSRRAHLLNWEPALWSPPWKNSWGGDDSLWICEVKASTENKIWFFAPWAEAHSTYPLAWPHWEQSWKSSQVNVMHCCSLVATFPPILRDYLLLHPTPGSKFCSDDASRQSVMPVASHWKESCRAGS